MQSTNWHPSFSSGPLEATPETNVYQPFVLKPKNMFSKNSQYIFSATIY